MHGFLLSGGTFTTLDDPSATTLSQARSINSLGQIVGFYRDAGGDHGFLFSGGQFTTIDDPSGGNATDAQGTNDAGQIVGYYRDSNGLFHGFLLNGGTFTTLDDPSGFETIAVGINKMGQIVGYYDSPGARHGFLYSGGQFTTIDPPLTVGYSTVNGINDMGQIVGEYRDAGGRTHGFLYSGGFYTTLDDPLAGSIGTEAFGINDMGQIVGDYFDSSNHQHGFLETTVPNTPPPGGTTADMILRGSNMSPAVAGQYEIYDIGNNAILAGYSLGQVGTDWALRHPRRLQWQRHHRHAVAQQQHGRLRGL